jgi:hypothetical protein
MNRTSLFRKSALALALVSGLAGALAAQKPGSHTDEKFANTTVVYRDSVSSDMEMLKRLDSDFSMGDVVRFDEAPPRPAPSAPLPAKLSPAKSAAPVLYAADNLETVLKTGAAPATAATSDIETPDPDLSLDGDETKVAENIPEPPAPAVIPAPLVKKSAIPNTGFTGKKAAVGKKQFYKHARKGKGVQLGKLFQRKSGKRIRCYKF